MLNSLKGGAPYPLRTEAVDRAPQPQGLEVKEAEEAEEAKEFQKATQAHTEPANNKVALFLRPLFPPPPSPPLLLLPLPRLLLPFSKVGDRGGIGGRGGDERRRREEKRG